MQLCSPELVSAWGSMTPWVGYVPEGVFASAGTPSCAADRCTSTAPTPNAGSVTVASVVVVSESSPLGVSTVCASELGPPAQDVLTRESAAVCK